MELAGLESKETQYDCYPMTLLFSLEKDYHLTFIQMTKNRHENCLSILFVVLFQLHDLLMQFFSSFLSNNLYTLSGSALNRIGFLVVTKASLSISLPMVALNMRV